MKTKSEVMIQVNPQRRRWRAHDIPDLDVELISECGFMDAQNDRFR
jgi:hypothetical protein